MNIIYTILFLFSAAFLNASDIDNLTNYLHENERVGLELLSHLQNEKIEIDTLKYVLQEEKYNALIVFIYKNDSLIFWSDNQIPVNELIKFSSTTFIHKFKNAYCEVRFARNEKYKFYVLIPIKKQYSYTNQYLENSFSNEEELPYDIALSKKTGSIVVKDFKGKNLFYLIKDSKKDEKKAINHLFVFLFSLLLFILFIHLIRKFKHYRLLLFSAFTVVLTVFYLYFLHVPTSLFLFDPSIFAWSGLIPSLGHLFYIFMILFAAVYIFYNNSVISWTVIRKNSLLIPLFGVLIKAVLVSIFFFFISVLVNNSSVLINLSDVFSVNSSLFFILVLLFLIIISIILFFLKIDDHIKSYIIDIKVVIVFIIVISALVYLVLGSIFSIILLLFLLISYLFTNSIVSIRLFIAMLFMSAFAIYGILKYNYEKEHKYRILYAEKLSNEADPLIEYSFKSLEDSIKKSEIVKDTLEKKEIYETKLMRFVNSRLSEGYWDKYNVTVTLCSSNDELYLQPQNMQMNCGSYFNSKTAQYGVYSSYPNLFLLDYNNYKTNYLGIIEFTKKNKLYLEFSSKNSNLELTYPKLLVDEKNNQTKLNYKYSYAKYVNHQLVSHSGSYFYNHRLKDKPHNTFTRENNYNHYHYKADDNITYVVSKPSQKMVNRLAPLPILVFLFYIFLGFGVCLIMPDYVFKKLHQLTFKNRLQITFILIILISFVSIGYWSIEYIRLLNDEKSKDIITEKIHSINLELSNKIKRQPIDSIDKAELEGYLVKFSNIFFTDINMYSLSGRLNVSSRAKLFNEGITSNLINKNAFDDLTIEGKSIVIQKEKIGNLDYWSAYMPFRNQDNQVVAYINVPYYARQTDVQEELSGFITTFLNIYFVLIAISVIIIIIISNYIVRPLNIIREHIRTLSISRKNEKILWKKNDEIGALVNEYNRMVDELVNNTERLMQSEREGAWREMARQIAHEIKNPLTPMRLSIQNLHRAWEDQAPDWEARFIRFKDMALEQIDTLSLIASEFSNFAQMPNSQKQETDLVKLITITADLFKEEYDIPINIDTQQEHVFIYADKDQMLRVFTNLIKNAVQAIDDTASARIDVRIRVENNSVYIDVCDNGSGIPEEMQDKIFQVNFTTKSSGTGLGLAMVKNIIENHNGQISFTSDAEKGTIFTVELPK